MLNKPCLIYKFIPPKLYKHMRLTTRLCGGGHLVYLVMFYTFMFCTAVAYIIKSDVLEPVGTLTYNHFIMSEIFL